MPRSHGSNWVGAPGAAAYLGTLRTLYRLIDQDGLPAYRVGRVIRLRWDAIDAFLDSKRIQPGELRRHLYPQRSLNTGGNVVVGRRLAGEVVFQSATNRNAEITRSPWEEVRAHVASVSRGG